MELMRQSCGAGGSMQITVNISGLQGVEDALHDAGPKLAKAALRKGLRAGADIFIADAKSRAPILKKPHPHRNPGDLKDSIGAVIKMSPKQEYGTVHVGPKRERGKGSEQPGVYGMFVEFGTDDAAAQPFMRPAFDSKHQQAQEAFTAEMKAGVEALGKK